MGKRTPLVYTEASKIGGGLFGHVMYHVFQILPYFYENRLQPMWEICASQYGSPPDFLTVPGAFDLAYTPDPGSYKRISLPDLRRQQGRILGNDWPELNRIWNTFFRVPPRILARAESVLPSGRSLGIHYRGKEKLTTLDDSNFFSQEDYLVLIREFLSTRSGDFDSIFAATDEYPFVEKLRAITDLPVINLGEVEFYRDSNLNTTRQELTDRAVLDCVLLSRCRTVVLTSSALSSFAKVLNPAIEIYRCAASKLFEDVPYFPVAFIPVIPVKSEQSIAVLRNSMAGDWTYDRKYMSRYNRTFTQIRRKPLRQFFLRLGYRFGVGRLIRLVVDARNRQIRARLSRNLQA